MIWNLEFIQWLWFIFIYYWLVPIIFDSVLFWQLFLFCCVSRLNTLHLNFTKKMREVVSLFSPNKVVSSCWDVMFFQTDELGLWRDLLKMVLFISTITIGNMLGSNISCHLFYLQYGNYQRRILVEDLNKKWKRVILNTSVLYLFSFFPLFLYEILAYQSWIFSLWSFWFI